MRRKRRWLLGLFLLVLILSLPFLSNLDVFRQQVRRVLQQQLGREVEFATLRARLLPRPALVGERVMISEQEGFGAEPFLYADEMECDLPLRALWTWRLACAEIHFLRPSINLVRNSDHAWNVGSFLLAGEPAGRPGAALGVTPLITASDARVNFKFGADKQVYALTGVELRLEPRADRGWRLALQARPMRTDRRLTETGELRVQGEIGRAPQFSALPFRFQANLKPGSLGQLVTLFTGREPPLWALASFATTLEGTPAAWRAQGTLTLDAVRRWDLVAPPQSPRWETAFQLKVLDWDATVEIEKASVRTARSEIELRGRVDDPFGRPRWELEVNAERLDWNELLAQFARLKANVAPDARLNGAGRLRLSAGGRFETWQGELTAPGGITLQVPRLAQPVELAGLRVLLSRGRVELQPLTLRFSPAQLLTLSGEWRPLREGSPYRLRWQSQRVQLEPLQEIATAFGWDLFGPNRWQGEAQFDLEWRGDALRERGRARWQGRLALRAAKFHPPEFNHPVDVPAAQVEWRGTRVEARPLVVRLGDDLVTGSLARDDRTGLWSASLSAEQLKLAALDELLNPGRRGLLARLVRPEPQQSSRWPQLAGVGDVRVGRLIAGPFRLQELHARAAWQGERLDLTRLRFRAYGGQFDGAWQGDFHTAPPQYRLVGSLKQVNLTALLSDTTELGPFFRGVGAADLTLQTAGTRPRELLRQLRGRVVGVVLDGTIAPINLFAAMSAAGRGEPATAAAGARTEFQSLAGEFRLADEQVELDSVRLIVDSAALALSGRVDFAGRLDLKLSGEPLQVAGRRPTSGITRLLSYSYRLTGTLRQPEAQLAEPVAASAGPPR